MLNYRIIFNTMGLLLIIESIAMAISIPMGLIYNEPDCSAFAQSTAITFFSGLTLWALFHKSPKNIGKREGYIIVSLVWIVFSVFGALPFMLSGVTNNFVDAFFETMSGFTTTGASIFDDIDHLPHGILLWRSMTQWLGGMGIIVLSVAILPTLGIGGMQLFMSEATGPTKDKIHPKIKENAKRLYAIYIFFTLLETILLLFSDITLFDAINHSMTTMASGGYSTHNDSIAYFHSHYIEIIVTLFMMISGVNFTLSYFAILGKFRRVWQSEEFRWYLYIILIFATIFAVRLYTGENLSLADAIRTAIFHVVSLCTTTGFIANDYMQWSPMLIFLTFTLLFFGSSAGSTSGGIKTIRIVLLAKNSYMELRRLLHPNAIIPVRLNKKVVNPQIVGNVLAFCVFYFIVIAFGTIVMTASDLDFDTALSATITSVSNVGPALGQIGSSANFAHIGTFGKYFSAFMMLIGRLELFTVIIIFTPSFWKN